MGAAGADSQQHQAPVRPGEWRVDVRFQGKGVLQAKASGLLLCPPGDALLLCTDAAGDALFRVVERTPLPPGPGGARRVEVVNRAAIRLLAWKLWSSNRVVYEVAPPPGQQQHQQQQEQQQQEQRQEQQEDEQQPGEERVSFRLVSSNMLNALDGTWRLAPVKVHHTALPAAWLGGGASPPGSPRKSPPGSPRSPRRLLLQREPSWSSRLPVVLGALRARRGASGDGSGCKGRGGSGGCWPPGLAPPDADGNVLATLVSYEQRAAPKGLPPGVRYVPGMSDAVRMSIGREVRAMLDKVAHVAALSALHGLTPRQALVESAQRLDAAGGSFKKMARALRASPPTSSVRRMSFQLRPYGAGARADTAAGAGAGGGGTDAEEAGADAAAATKTLKRALLSSMPLLDVSPLQLLPLDEDERRGGGGGGGSPRIAVGAARSAACC